MKRIVLIGTIVMLTPSITLGVDGTEEHMGAYTATTTTKNVCTIELNSKEYRECIDWLIDDNSDNSGIRPETMCRASLEYCEEQEVVEYFDINGVLIRSAVIESTDN